MEAELISGHEAFSVTLAKLLVETSRDWALLSEKLDPRIYGHPQVLEAVQQFALTSHRRQSRILIADARAAVAGRNPLLALARKLPSRIELRELAEEHRNNVTCERLLVDSATRMLERLSPEHLDASYYPHANSRTLQRLKEFDLMWESAQPSLDLSGLR